MLASFTKEFSETIDTIGAILNIHFKSKELCVIQCEEELNPSFNLGLVLQD